MAFFSSAIGLLGGGLSAGSGALGGLATSALQYKFNRNLMKYQYELNQRSLQDSPSSFRDGLESAGYNPMLAVTQGIHPPSVGGSSVSAPSIDINSALQSHKQRKLLDAQREQVNAQTSILRAEASSAKSQAALDKEYAEMELEALKDEDYKVLVNGQDSNPTRSEYRQMIRNDIQRRRYTNSREHAMAEDAVNAIHGGTSAYESFERARMSRRRYNYR